MDYLAEIKKKEDDLQELRDRQDNDLDLFNLLAHEMQKADGGGKMPKMQNVTLPAPQSYAKRVLAVLHKATRQTVVEGDKLDDKQTHKIEQFIDIGFGLADDLLGQKQIVGLKPYLNSMAALRGWIGARTRVYQSGKETVFDLLPWDMRDATWESLADGLGWAAYKRKRDKAIVERDYGYEGTGRDAEVTDVWDRTHNYIFVDGRQMGEPREHGLGYVPVMIQPVSLVPMLTLRDSSTDSAWRYFGESIFSGSRTLHPKLNDLATLFQTMGVEAYHPAMQKLTDDLNEDIEIPESGQAVPVRPDQVFREMPKRDMYQIQLHTWNVLNAELQRATLPYIEFGELAFELSAVAIAKLGEGRELIFAPIIIALSMGYRQIARMMIDQYTKGNFGGQIGRAGRKIDFTPKQLEGDYDIRFDFHSISPEENIANYAVAQAAKALNILPDDVILTEILKRSNPADDKMKMAEQRLQQEVPTLYLFNQAHRLVDDKRYVEARLIADQIGISLEQITAPQTKAGAKKVKGMPSGGVKLPQGGTEMLQAEMGRRGLRPQEER